MNREDQGVWPLIVDARAPWDGPWPDDDLGYADHVASPVVQTRPEAEYRLAALALQAHLTELFRGEAYDSARLDALAESARVPLSRAWDRRPVFLAPLPVDEEMLSLLALDAVPDAGQRSADEVLGPWRLALDPVADRATFAHALAQWAVSGPGRSPIERWTRSRQAPDAPMRAAVRAIWNAPVGLWRVRALDDGLYLDDLLGLDPRRVPTGPVLGRVDRDVQVGDALLARLIPLEDGSWRLYGGLQLARVPPRQAIDTVVHIGLVRLRLRRRRSSLDDLFREAACWWMRQWMLWAFPT